MLRPKQVGPYPGDTPGIRGQFYKWTGEQPRAILAGEYYLSGAIPQAYRAHADLVGPYFPAVPIKLEPCPHCHGTGEREAHE